MEVGEGPMEARIVVRRLEKISRERKEEVKDPA